MTKKLTKRIISFVVTLAMVMVLLPTIPATAAMDATSPATYLASQLDPTYSSETQKGNNVTVEGNTVKLTNNLEVTANSATGQPWINVMCWSGDEITLDVGTYTLTLGEDLFIAPSTKDKTLKITGSGGKITKNGQYPAIDMQYGSTSLNVSGNITIENTYDKSTIVTDDGETKVAGVAIGATLNGGGNNQITIGGNDVTVKGVRALDIANGTNVTINGGTFTGSGTEDYCPIVVRRGEPAADGLPAVSNLTIKGGTITGKPTGVAVWDGSTVSVEGGTISAEGTKGDKAYSGNGILVATTDGYEGTEKSTVNISNGAVTGEYAVLAYGEKAAVEISGGTVGGLEDGTESGVCAYDGASAEIKDGATVQGRYAAGAFGGGKLTVSGGTVTGKTAGIGTNGSDKDETTEITVKGGTITGETAGVYLPAGTMNVTAGTISGKAGIVVRGGDLDVQGGTITATGTDNVTIGDALDGSTGMRYSVPAAGITVDVADYPAQVDGQKRVTIGEGATIKATTTGGKTLAACKGTEEVKPSGGDKVSPDENPFSVSGGTFTTGTDGTAADENVNQFLADGYDVGTGGKIEEKVADPEVKLNDVEYKTLNEAIAAAGNGDKITLLKDVNISDTITIASGALTIDLADHNITSTKARVFVVKTGGSLIIDGTTGVVSNSSAGVEDVDFMFIADGANTKVTINGGTIEQTKDHIAVQIQNGAAMTLTGGTIKKAAETTTKYSAVQVTGTFNMTGGTIESGTTAFAGFDAGTNIDISGGTLTGKATGVSVQTGATAEIKGSAKVSGNFGATVSGGSKLTVSGEAQITGTGKNAESGIEVKGENTTAEIKENAKVSGDYGIYAKENAQLTVSGGEVTGSAAGIGTNGDDKTTPATITVSGGNVSGDTAGVYLPSGKMTVENGANITGPAGIVQFGGELTVNGGTITANGTADVEIGASGKAVPPAAVATNKQDGYGEVSTQFTGGTFTAAEGKPAVTYTENGEEATPEAETFKVEGGTYKTGTDADLSVYQYVGDEHAVDPENGTVGATTEVPLTIIDFGYVEDIDAEGVVDADGIFTSAKDIKYNARTAQWTDATFYWCFNRALKESENVEITLTANGKTYTDTCNGDGVSPRYAASFLSNSQFGDEVSTNGVQIGDYTISGKITGGAADTTIEAAAGVNPVNVDKVPDQLSGGYAPVVVAATIADRTAEGTIEDAATDATATYVGTTPGESGKTIYNIIGTAKNLKKHLNGAASPTEGYWFGIEIKAPTGVDTEGADKMYKVTIDGEEAGSSTFDALPHIEEGTAKGAIIYFNVKGDDTDKHTVDIEWASGTTYTYSIDLTGVELYGAASFVEGETDSYGFIAKGNNELLNGLAPLVKGEGEAWGTPIADCKDNTFYAAFKVDPANADGKSYTVKFANESGNSYSTTIDAATKGGIAYFTPAWQDGVDTNNIPTENYQGKYTVTVTKTGDKNPDDTAEIKVYKVVYKAEGGKFGEATEQDSGLYAASVTEADTLTTTKPEVTPDDGFKAAEWGEGVASDEDYTITYTATCAKEYVPVVAAATIADSDGNVANVVGDYSAEYTEKDAATGNYKIKGTATDLKKHTNGKGTEGYWFGVEIQAPDDVVTEGKTYDVSGDKTAEGVDFDDLPNATGKGAIIYFDTKGDGTETYTVNIAWDTTTTYTYVIDLTEVKHYVENPTVSVGNTGEGTESTDYKATVDETYTDKGTYKYAKVTFTTETGNKVPYGANGVGTEGNWVGITVQPPAGSRITGLATATAEELPTTFAQPDATQGDSEQLSGYYIDASKEPIEKPFFFVEITDDTSGAKTVYCYELAKGTQLELAEKPVTTYTVTCETATGGQVTADKTDVAAGDTVTLTVTADSGYNFGSLSVKKTDNTEVETAQQADGTYTFTMPASNVTVTATFAAVEVPTTYTVTCETATGGKVEADKTADLAEGETVTLTVTADSGYNFGSLTVKNADGTEVETEDKGDGTYTFTMPASNVTVTATFTAVVVPTTYTVTIETATGGKVEADKTADLAEGETVTLTVTADSGYSFESLSVKDADGTEVETTAGTDGTYTFTMPASNVTVTATFTAVEVPTTYTVTIETATGGKVEADKTADLAEGETVTLTVTADSGYSFGSLSVKDAEGTEVETEDKGDGTYTFTMPASNVTVTATFTADVVPTTYTVTIETVTGGKVEADKTDVAEGDTVTLTVTPDSNYNFGGLAVNDAEGTKVKTTRQADGTYTFTMPASNVTVTPTFSRKSSGGSRGGGGSASSGETSYSVSVPSKSNNGSVSANLKSATKGSKVTFTVTPNMGYMASGVTVKDANGNEIAVTDNGDGTYTFVMPDSKVSIAAEFVKEGTETPNTTPTPGAEENCPSEKFTDVDQSLWYHEGIDYALTNGLMNGMSDTTFEPNSTTTRAMVVAVLYRLDGSPVTAQASFADVPADAWYADAVAWGEANGVVSGYNEETFGPSDSITREQMAAILYRYAQYKGIDVSAQADLSKYSDADAVSDWANTALSWANAEGLISGMSDTELAPTDTATRAQVASILMRFCENIVK